MITKYNQLRELIRNNPNTTKWLKRIGIFSVGFIIATAIYAEPYEVEKVVTKEVVKRVEVPVEKVVTKEIEKKVEVEKTPTACIDALKTDDKMFLLIAESLGAFDFETLADDIEAMTPERLAHYDVCMETR